MCYTDPFAVPGAQPPTTCRDCVNGGGEDRCFGSPPVSLRCSNLARPRKPWRRPLLIRASGAPPFFLRRIRNAHPAGVARPTARSVVLATTRSLTSKNTQLSANPSGPLVFFAFSFPCTLP